VSGKLVGSAPEAEGLNPKKEWQGAWIPRSVWIEKKLTWMEKCLWSEIYSLHDEKRGGCWASNSHLAKIMDSTPASIANAISKMRKLGMVQTVSISGMSRVILAVDPIHQVMKGVNQVVKGGLTTRLKGVNQVVNKDTRLVSRGGDSGELTRTRGEAPRGPKSSAWLNFDEEDCTREIIGF